MQKLEFTCEADSRPRLDQFLSDQLPEKSRSYLKKLITEGNVLVNGQTPKASRPIAKNEIVSVELPEDQPLDVKPQDIPLNILYEDDQIIVINKPVGMVVHPAPGHTEDTLVNALLYHCKDLSGIGGITRPGIVHRLDVGTSGVLIAAKNDLSHQSLSAQFQDRKVEKIYNALVFGSPNPPEGMIDVPIGRDLKDRKKISGNTGIPRDALTEYKIVKRWQHFSFLEVKLHTGRTHQIRAHLAHIRYPIVGDEMYSGKRWRGVEDSQLAKKARIFKRPALHAYKLGIDHPVSGERMEFIADLPEDIAKFVKFLGEPK